MATVVPSTQVNAKRHPIVPCRQKTCIVRAYRFIQRYVWIDFQFRLDPGPPLGVHVVAVARSINLDILHAIGRKLAEVAFHDLHDVPQQRRMIFIDLVRDSDLERDSRKLRSARQRHFNRELALGVQEREFVARQRPRLTQLGGNDPRHAADGGVERLSCLPRAAHSAGHIEPLDRVSEITHKISPPQLAIRGSLKSELFLFGKYAPDVLILELPQAIWIGAAPCFEQVRGAQKTTDVIRSEQCRHASYSSRDAWRASI